MHSLRISVLQGPIFGLSGGANRVGFKVFSDRLVKRIIKVGSGKQNLDRQQDRSDLEGGAPLVLQDVEADAAQLVDVGVVNLRAEENLGWRHGVLLGQEELTVEEAAFIGSAGRSGQLHNEMSGVVFGRNRENSTDGVFCEILCLLDDTGWDSHIAVLC